jgi:hypothetical protein
VKELIEALKRFPLDAKVYYEMGPNGPGTIGKAQCIRAGVRRAGSFTGPIDCSTQICHTRRKLLLEACGHVIAHLMSATLVSRALGFLTSMMRIKFSFG